MAGALRAIGRSRQGPLRVVAALVLLSVPALIQCAGALPPTKRVDQFRLDTWTVRDGMPGYDITSLAQTPDGYIWIGTTQGLMRFDGVAFSAYDHRNLPGLTNSTIRSLTTTYDGSLWIGAEWCGFGKLIDGKYVRVPYADENWNTTRYFHESPDGTLWIGYQAWRYMFRIRNGVLKRIDIPTGLCLTGAVDLPNGDLLAAESFGGLYRVSKDDVVTPYNTTPGLPSNDFTSMVQTADGTVWCGTEANGLFRIKGKQLSHLTVATGLASNAIRCLYADSSQRLWVGTNNGLDCIDSHGIEHFGAADGLTGNDVGAILQDREGNIWVSTGIYLHRFADTRLSPIILGGTPLIASVSVAPGGGIYCGTQGGLWSVPSAAGNGPKRVTTSETTGGLRTKSGDLVTWYNHNVRDCDLSILHAGAWSHYALKFRPLKIIDSGHGLDIYGQFREYQRWPDQKNANLLFPFLYDAQVYDVQAGPGGCVWFATTAGLIIYKDGVAGIVDLRQHAVTHVLSIDTSNPRQLWLATNRGLVRVDIPPDANTPSAILRSAKATTFTVKDGLPSNDLLQVVADDVGSVWAGGYFGLFSVRLADLHGFENGYLKQVPTTQYKSADGIRSYPYVSLPAKTADGKLWFPGSRGITMVDPASMQHNDVVPPVRIEDVSANGIDIGDRNNVHVKPGRGTLDVQYTALSFVEPENVHFKYLLTGYDTNWVDVGKQRKVSFTNLPPGPYTFKVIACNNDGVWNNVGDTIHLELLPYFYQTLWFRILLALAGLLLIGQVIVIRTRSIAARAHELEIAVSDRTGELVEANRHLREVHAELEVQNEHLQDSQAEVEARNLELIETQEVLARANARLEALATTDGLTGLINHRTYHEQLELEWNRHTRYGSPLSIIMVDVDRFKEFNDTFGHPAGDEVLRVVAGILRATVRESDLVARYGEEFVIIAPETDAVSAANLAERLRVAIESHDWPRRPVTGSFGVTTASLDTLESSKLTAQADEALYKSKRAGRNRVTQYGATEEPVVEKPTRRR